jgi:hypothetical protein
MRYIDSDYSHVMIVLYSFPVLLARLSVMTGIQYARRRPISG